MPNYCFGSNNLLFFNRYKSGHDLSHIFVLPHSFDWLELLFYPNFAGSPSLLSFSFLSWGGSWTNIISEFYCPSWHLTISRACLCLSTPRWASKCSVLHCLNETKPSIKACRNRRTFLHLSALPPPSLAVYETRQSEPPTNLLPTERDHFRNRWAVVLMWRTAPPTFWNTRRVVLCISPLSLFAPQHIYFLSAVWLLLPLGNPQLCKRTPNPKDQIVHKHRNTRAPHGGWCKDRLHTGVKHSLGGKWCVWIMCNYFT